MREIYLDNSATTRCFPETAELMNKLYLEEYGNPSSMHHKGVEAERRLTEASAILAGILKVRPANLIYTSCGTESDNLAIIGAAMAMRRSGRHLITTVIEHPAVLETMRFLEEQGFEVTYLPVDAEGQVSPQAVEAAVREDTILVSVMHTNNEIGTIQPIEEIGAAVKRRNPRTLFHVDAVQGFGKARILPKKGADRPPVCQRPQDSRRQRCRLPVYRRRLQDPPHPVRRRPAEGHAVRHPEYGRYRGHGPVRPDPL